MSAFGVPPEISALQATQAQREAARVRDRTRATLERRRSVTEEEDRFRVQHAADIADVRPLEEEASGEDERSRRRRERDTRSTGDRPDAGPDAQGHIDITA